MGTEFNYVARLDTTQIMSGLAEIRSQVGMALSSPTGFMAPAMALMGGGGGMSDFSSGVSSQFRQMFAGMSQAPGMMGGSGYGQTFTNPAIAYSPHYGAVQAQTTLGQELLINHFGLNAAQQMKPPGVSSAEYALGVQSNFIDRQIDANHAAKMAAQSSFYAGVGGMGGGELASMAATPIGAAAGSAIATRLLGAGAAGAGGMLGGLAAGWYAYNAGSDLIGGAIENHFAKIERIEGITRELGEMAGAGRGLTRSQRTELGISARQAAGDINMDANEMGDILALSRENSMLPNATNPEQARTQFREFARTIEEGAQILHTSLSNAMQVVKSASMSGMSSQEAIVRAAASGGFEQWSQLHAFGMMGAEVGRSMGYTGAQGSGVFMSSLGGAGAAGLSHEEMRIMGGRFAAAQFLGQSQMAMAQSPLGNAQLMASMGGQSLGGMGMMDVAGAALGGLSAGGGDMMSNMIRFTVHQNELRRGIGAHGIQTMARQQIMMGGEMISSLAPGVSTNDAQRMYAQSMGMSPDQAKLLVGGITHHGGSSIGGGVGALGQMNAIEAMQGSMLHGRFEDPGLGSGPSFGLGYALEGAMLGGYAGTGLGIGTVGGAIAGGVGGLIAGNVSAAWDMLTGPGPGLFASAQDKADFYSRQQAAEYDRRMNMAKAKMGYVDVDKAAGARFLNATDLSNVRLDFDLANSPVASAQTRGTMLAMGLHPVQAGPGTMRVDGQYWSAAQFQAQARRPMWDRQITQAQNERTMGAAVAATYGEHKNRGKIESDISRFKMYYETIRLGETPNAAFGGSISPVVAGANLLPAARTLIEDIDPSGPQAAERKHLLGILADSKNHPNPLGDPEVRSFLQQTANFEMQGLNGALMAGRAGAVATDLSMNRLRQDEASYLAAAYGDHRVSRLSPFSIGAGGISSAVLGTKDRWELQQEAMNAFAGRADPESETNRTLLMANDLHANIMKSIRSGGTPLTRNRAYFDALTQDPYYQAMKVAHHNKDDDKAQKLLDKAQLHVLVTHPGDFRYMQSPHLSLKEEHETMRPGAGATQIMANWMMTAARATGAVDDDKLHAVDKELHKQIYAKTSFSKNLDDEWEVQAKGKLQAPRKKIGGMTGGTMEHAIGFGEQESAMASIKRSLEHTESALKALDKKISGPAATPQQSAHAQTTTGGHQ